MGDEGSESTDGASASTGTGGSGSGGDSTSGGGASTGSGGGGGTGGSGGNECTDPIELTTAVGQVDLIIVVDNSGSMADDLSGLEATISSNLMVLLEESGLDYRVIVVSRHRDDDNTSLCISSPLSTVELCPAEAPGFSERFFHYSARVQSQDSFDILLDTYEPPFDPGNEDQYDNAPNGWSEWLRVDADKAIIEASDGDENMPAATFVQALTTMAPAHFGSGSANMRFVFHSMVGAVEKSTDGSVYLPEEPIVTEVCSGEAEAGTIYQELSILTGGLRFPICQYALYEAFFRALVDRLSAQMDPCELTLADTPDVGLVDNLDAIRYRSSDGEEINLTRVMDADGCASDTFYVESDHVILCSDVCETVVVDGGSATLNGLFECN